MEWISVKQEVPPEYKEVLVSFRNPYEVSTGYRTPDHWFTHKANHGAQAYITHWMPLPAAPLEAGK